MSRHRIAIVGAGIGAQHVEACLANAERFAVAAVCDLDGAKAEALAARAPGAVALTDYAQVLARDDVDIVDICLPPRLHVEASAAALQSGRHVICEKPLAGSLREVDRLAEIARAQGRHLVPVYQYRFGNGLRKLRHLVETGLAGRPFVATVETHWNRLPAYYAVPWRGKKASELGGCMISHSIHAHDLAMLVLGPARRVFAKVATRVNPIETEDCAAVCLEMANGALVTLSVTLGCAEERSRLRFCFENLTAESGGPHPYRPAEEPWRFLPRGALTEAEIESALEGLPPRKESFAGLFEGIARMLDEGAPPPVAVADARASLELATAVYYSSATGNPVELPLGADHPAYDGWLPWLPG